LLCWKSINGIVGFSKMGIPPILQKQQQLSCRAFSVIALLVTAFGPHDPQTVRYLTSFCAHCLRIESKRYEVTGEWRKLHNEELNDLYSSPNIVRVIKSRTVRGHIM
jgi:hypothetical protein